ncbi:MAG: polysaccharide biosynthesis protein [Acidobacteria bacterium]|nr:polysaccharide biosynthesis protein [Acidobacteriota bacterium]
MRATTGMTSLLQRIVTMESVHRFGIWTVQLCLFVLSGLAAFVLRFDGEIPPNHQVHLMWGLAVWLVTKSVVFRFFGLDRGWWRFVSVDDVMRIGVGNLTASVAAFAVIRLWAPPGFPRSIYLLDLVICFLATSGVRLAVRILRDTYDQGGGEARKRTLVYGAGAAGISLVREIRANAKLPYAICGFVDDDARKAGLVIQGTKVVGCGRDLAKVVAKHRVEVVLIAMPAATGHEMTRILRVCQEAGVAYKTVPGLGEIIEGNGLAKQIRDVAVEDLLGRSPARLEEEQIREKIEGRVVMVTGGAGSIGSELCRQIARFRPAAIVGFEVAESPLFELDREMRQRWPETGFHPEIGSIQNRARLDEVLRQYAPAVVYHAAAYKHVPMMEAHVFEAIENNVFGTYNVAVAAAEHGAEDFVLISSDKAVRPTNVMGATKRVAELLVLGLQNGRTKYVAVRFGNVLGSNGSVIPIFKQQIAAGGPVTVTHPEMRRYFMTIPEASQLVLQASAFGEAGQVFVLDMGEPVKIVDLARNLILLSGLRPGEDIRIEFTGLRPGEKMYEELSTLLEDTVPTAHEKIRVHTGNGLPEGDMAEWLGCLREVCESRDLGRLVVTLKEIVPDYSPSAHLLKRVVGSGAKQVAVTAG